MTIDTEAEELIDDAAVMAHLATSVEDRPHVAPVWYAYDDGTISILTGGRKAENARENPRVSVSFEASTDGSAEWMVVVRGTATVIEDRERRREAAERIFPKYLGPDTEEWDDYYRRSVEDAPDSVLVEIEVGSTVSQRY